MVAKSKAHATQIFGVLLEKNFWDPEALVHTRVHPVAEFTENHNQAMQQGPRTSLALDSRAGWRGGGCTTP